MVINKDIENIKKQKALEKQLSMTEEEKKDALFAQMRGETLGVLCLALMYAKNFEALGVDVTEKIVTAEQQAAYLEKAYNKGYEEGLLKGREIEGETIKKRLELEKNRKTDNYDYLDRNIGSDTVQQSLRNLVRPTHAQRSGKRTKKRHKR